MKQFVKWDVKEVRMEQEAGYSPKVTATLVASSPFGTSSNVKELHADLYNRLNPSIDSLYPQTMLSPEMAKYIANDTTATELFFRAMTAGRRIGEKDAPKIVKIEKVLFNDPATIVFWKDDTKTVVKAQNNEKYDPEKGLAMAMCKKIMGNKGNYYNEIKKWVEAYEWPRRLMLKVGIIKPKEQRMAEQAEARLMEVFRNKKATKAEMSVAIEEALKFLAYRED